MAGNERLVYYSCLAVLTIVYVMCIYARGMRPRKEGDRRSESVEDG